MVLKYMRTPFPGIQQKCCRKVRLKPGQGTSHLDEPVGHHKLGDRREDVTGVRLQVEAELLIGAHPYICASRGSDGFLNAGQRRPRVRVAVDDEHGPWRDEREHRPGVVVAVDPRRNAIVEAADECGIDMHTFVACGLVDRGENMPTRACH